MPNNIVVDAALYKRIQSAKLGEEVAGYVHLHTKNGGTCEVICGGRKPISCNCAPSKPSGKPHSKKKNGRHNMVFTKK